MTTKRILRAGDRPIDVFSHMSEEGCYVAYIEGGKDFANEFFRYHCRCVQEMD